MTIGEFQAWLDGFCDGKEMPLSNEQFYRIRSKLRDEVDRSRKTIELSDITFPTHNSNLKAGS